MCAARGHRTRAAAPLPKTHGDADVLDTLMVAIGLAFFIVATLYVVACDRL